MKQQFALTLVSVCALLGYACSPEEDEMPAYDATTGAVLDAAPTGTPSLPDSAAMSPAFDAGSPIGNPQEAGIKQDAASVTTTPEASTVDARVTPEEASTPDAEVVRDASVDAMVSAGAKPSAGCGKGGRPSGGRVSVQGSHNFVFPTSYDGKQPLPLLIGFHAASNPIEQIENLTKGSDFEKNYVRAFPKSKGTAWDYDSDIAKVLAMYDSLTANHCVDLSRVFATGHSSGAQLIVQILTPAHKADADRLGFKAVAPVAASRYGTVGRAIPVLYIQGARDSVRNSSGSDVVKEFTTANGCMTASTPYAGAPMCMRNGKTVNNGCIQYQGCKQPTLWCSHDDPEYSSTNHGWPCFATKAMYDFFTGLP